MVLTEEFLKENSGVIAKLLGDANISFSSDGVARKNDPPLAPVGPYLHGTGGLFNRRDRANPVFSAIMTPEAGAADAIPVFNGARYLNNEFGATQWAYSSLITGQTAGDLDDFDNQPTELCVDGPTAGLTKFCTIVNELGNYRMSTREVNDDVAGRVEDMVDAATLQVANQFPQAVFGTPTPTPSLQNAMSNELAARIVQMIIGFQRMFYPRVFIGSPANNVGEKRDIVGLDIHINAGNKVDARSGNVCTAANADVKNFGSNVVGSASGRNIMQYIEMCDAFVTHKARRQGMGTPTYVIAMRPELWQEITEIIPIQKYERILAVINRVTNGRGNVNAADAYSERDGIRASMLIPVNGRFLRVVIDDTIAEVATSPGGVPTYASTIYGIPLTAGGIPVTFWEYFNHDNNQARAIQQRAGGFRWTTDGGLFKWTSDFAKGCLKLNATITPRLQMLTPQLSWRIDNVACQPLQHFASYNPDSAYFTDGGTTTGDGQKFYAEWSTATPVYP